MRHIRIPRTWPVQPLKPDDQAEDRATCGGCGLSWDDGKITSMTPTPSARCPFEPFHNPPGPRSGKPLKRFIITETLRVEISATSINHAKKRWLESGDVWELMRKGFIDVRERTIAPVNPDLTSVRDALLDQAEEF